MISAQVEVMGSKETQNQPQGVGHYVVLGHLTWLSEVLGGEGGNTTKGKK